MKEIKTGSIYKVEEIVTQEKSASQVGSGLLDVYSTPAMIAFMEKASYLCIEQFLDQNESTVGGAVNIKHLKPTVIGKKVVCTSKVISVDRKKIEFELEVKEDDTVIGTGNHTRFVIDKESFLKLL